MVLSRAKRKVVERIVTIAMVHFQPWMVRETGSLIPLSGWVEFDSIGLEGSSVSRISFSSNALAPAKPGADASIAGSELEGFCGFAHGLYDKGVEV